MGNDDSSVKNDKGLPYVNTKDTIIMYKCFQKRILKKKCFQILASKLLLVLALNDCTAQLLNVPLLPTKYNLLSNPYLHEIITVFLCFIIRIVFYIQRSITT